VRASTQTNGDRTQRSWKDFRTERRQDDPKRENPIVSDVGTEKGWIHRSSTDFQGHWPK
jgi:hypothetical protein